jgi:hypothetical protein
MQRHWFRTALILVAHLALQAARKEPIAMGERRVRADGRGKKRDTGLGYGNNGRKGGDSRTTASWHISPSLPLRHHSSCRGQDRIRSFSKSGLKCFRHILAQSLVFKTPYVWDDRRPRPRVKERSPCRAVGHVHERRLDAASDFIVTAVLPV